MWPQDINFYVLLKILFTKVPCYFIATATSFYPPSLTPAALIFLYLSNFVFASMFYKCFQTVCNFWVLAFLMPIKNWHIIPLGPIRAAAYIRTFSFYCLVRIKWWNLIKVSGLYPWSLLVVISYSSRARYNRCRGLSGVQGASVLFLTTLFNLQLS